MEGTLIMLKLYEQAADALVHALRDDPFFAAIGADLADETVRRERLAQYFVYSLKEAQQFGAAVMPAPDCFGAAIWLFPQPAEVQQSMASAKKKFMAELLGQRGQAQYEAIVGFMHQHIPPALPSDSWYLSIAGVAPDRQGRGLGERLLRPTLDEADQAGKRCYLETFSARNMRFYARLGFREVISQVETLTNSRYWIMLREPQAV